ncbi:MAG: Uma2 family endonuclease [Planctomycetaceae bacterium]|nr:Uma2 family endonuclease [Planctomycetaceae bacterium]
MSLPNLLTIEQFVAQREEAPDAHRWTELLAGRLVIRQPPTLEHGTAMLNFTKALGEFLHREPQSGSARFDLGLIVSRNPDTLQFPAVCFFVDPPQLDEGGTLVTDARPDLIVEIASTNDRRRNLRQRVTGWLDWGVKLAWVLDPEEKQAHAFATGRIGQKLAEHQHLFGSPVLSGFKVNVGDLFKEPSWAK